MVRIHPLAVNHDARNTAPASALAATKGLTAPGDAFSAVVTEDVEDGSVDGPRRAACIARARLPRPWRLTPR
jgi:hypothetical protein